MNSTPIIERVALENGVTPEKVVHIFDSYIEHLSWNEVWAFNNELRRGQATCEDAGGFMIRCIRGLLGRPTPRNEIRTYKDAIHSMIRVVKDPIMTTEQKPETTEMLACRHCLDGGKPYVVQDDEPHAINGEKRRVSYCEVGCNTCGIHMHGIYTSPEPLLVIWNRPQWFSTPTVDAATVGGDVVELDSEISHAELRLKSAKYHRDYAKALIPGDLKDAALRQAWSSLSTPPKPQTTDEAVEA